MGSTEDGGKYVPLSYVKEKLLGAATAPLEERLITPPHPVRAVHRHGFG
ncbi:MAG: hypothetical protein AAF531_20560 [Actinomycetota bacterium]